MSQPLNNAVCPNCKQELEYAGEDPLASCSGLHYYRCINPNCGKKFSLDRRAISPLSKGSGLIEADVSEFQLVNSKK